MGPLSTYNKLRMANPQVQLPGELPLVPARSLQPQQAAVQPQQAQTMQQVDTGDAINSLAGMLVTPAEREAQQQRLLENKRRMIAWTGLFDGLRNLANLYSVSKGAAPMKFTDNPYQQIEQGYQQEMKNLDDVQRNRQAYAQQIWNLRRQADQDQIRQEAHKAQMDYTKAREDALREDSRRKDDYNLARTNYYKAVANKNDEQAEYWRLKALGVPEESAAKIAKDNALAARANRTGGGSSRSGSQGYETIVTEGFDENGNKVKKTVKQPRQNSRSGNSKYNKYKKGTHVSGQSNKDKWSKYKK